MVIIKLWHRKLKLVLVLHGFGNREEALIAGMVVKPI
jgi:hypothetical protein